MGGTARLPPLNGIRVFECAARHLNFRRAAEELHVTPGAVSQQIKQLEASLQVRLFDRTPSALRLTPAGEQLFPVATATVRNLHEALAKLRTPRQVVRLSAAPTFCTRWLVPRLGSFYSRYPRIEVHVDASAANVDLHSDPFDLVIRRVRERKPDLYVRCLFPDDVVALCTPQLAAQLGGDLAQLRNTKLLCWTWQDNWQAWLDVNSAGRLEDYEQAHFSHLMLVLDAAQAGHGVALTSRRLVRQDLAQGRLVHVFGPPLPSGYEYSIVARPDAVAAPHVRAFVDWTLQEAAADDAD